MSSPNINRQRADRPPKLAESPQSGEAKPRVPVPDSDNKEDHGRLQKPNTPIIPGERDRLRDIIVVFIAYPLTPTDKAEKVGKKMPWLEVISLVLKAALAAFAIYKGVEPGEW